MSLLTATINTDNKTCTQITVSPNLHVSSQTSCYSSVLHNPHLVHHNYTNIPMLATGQLPLQLSLNKGNDSSSSSVSTSTTTPTTCSAESDHNEPSFIDSNFAANISSAKNSLNYLSFSPSPSAIVQSNAIAAPQPTLCSNKICIQKLLKSDQNDDNSTSHQLQASNTKCNLNCDQLKNETKTKPGNNYAFTKCDSMLPKFSSETIKCKPFITDCSQKYQQDYAQQQPLFLSISSHENHCINNSPPSSILLQRLPVNLINSIRAQLLNEPLLRLPTSCESSNQPCLDRTQNTTPGLLSLPCSPNHGSQSPPALLNHSVLIKNENIDTNFNSKNDEYKDSVIAEQKPIRWSSNLSPLSSPTTSHLLENSQKNSISQGHNIHSNVPNGRRPTLNEGLNLARSRKAIRRHRRKRPPDGGYGWVVVFASFLISVVADGVAFSFGTIYVELIKHFGASKYKTAWVGSLFFSMPLLAGPVASALTDRYGCRLVTIASGLIASIGFLLSSYVQSLELLYVTFSLSGCGLALSYVTGIVIVAHYFEKRRSLATGLAVCGTGIGTFLFPPLTIQLLKRFQWQGTLQVHALLFLVIIFCGCLMKDLNSPSKRSIKRSANKKRSMTTESLSESSDSSSSSSSDSDSSSSESSTSDCESSSVTPTTNANTCISSSCDSFTSRESREIQRNNHKTSGTESPSEDSPSPPRPRTLSVIELPTYLRQENHLLHTRTSQFNCSQFVSNKEKPLLNLTESSSAPLQRLLAQSLRKRPYFNRILQLYPSLQNQHPLLVPTPPALLQPAHSDTMRQQVQSSDALKSTKDKNHCHNDDIATQERCPHHQKNKKSKSSKSARHYQSTIALANENVTDTANETSNSKMVNTNRCSQCKLKSNTILNQAHVSNPVQQHSRLFPQQWLQALVGRQTGNYFRHIKLKRDSISYRTAMLNTNRYRLKASSCPDIYRNSLMALHHEHGKSGFLYLMKQFIRHILDVSLLKNCRFTLFCISNSFLYACIDIPYIYIPEYAIQAGSSDKRASYLISVIGIVNTLGIVIVGYIGDKTWIRTPNLYSMLTTVSGVAIFLLPIIRSYEGMLSLAALYGFSISVNYTLISVILVDILTIERFTSGYGFLLLVQGISSLIGPPIAGWLFDISGSYHTTFFVTGVCIMISGVIVLPVEKRNKCNLLLRRCNSRPGSDSNSMICKAVAAQSNLLTNSTSSNPNKPRQSVTICVDENSKLDKK